MADGAGNKSHALDGAKIAVKTSANLLLNNFAEYIALEDRYIRYEITARIFYKLEDYAKLKNSCVEECGSTLLVVSLDLSNKQYLALHVGDGLIGYKQEEQVKILSHPINGITKNHTYLTISPDILGHFRIYRGNLDNIKEFFLMSDGVTELIYEKRKFLEPMQNLIAQSQWHNLEDILSKAFTPDDYSLVSLALR